LTLRPLTADLGLDFSGERQKMRTYLQFERNAQVAGALILRRFTNFSFPEIVSEIKGS
jgi:hypothetical protein